MNTKQFVQRLDQCVELCRSTMRAASEQCTKQAIAVAQEKTPPTGDLSGTNTRTGELKAHWATDSRTKPVVEGNTYTTELANNKEYASYVNDGHRMDRHFVPGLYVNPYSGQLEYDASAKVGMMVGTKTSYVPGLHMKEAAAEDFSKRANESMTELAKTLKEALK